ncbi:MAG: hypothetical protein ACI4NE_09570 [Succinivibrio sp.]
MFVKILPHLITSKIFLKSMISIMPAVLLYWYLSSFGNTISLFKAASLEYQFYCSILNKDSVNTIFSRVFKDGSKLLSGFDCNAHNLLAQNIRLINKSYDERFSENKSAYYSKRDEYPAFNTRQIPDRRYQRINLDDIASLGDIALTESSLRHLFKNNESAISFSLIKFRYEILRDCLLKTLLALFLLLIILGILIRRKAGDMPSNLTIIIMESYICLLPSALISLFMTTDASYIYVPLVLFLLTVYTGIWTGYSVCSFFMNLK